MKTTTNRTRFYSLLLGMCLCWQLHHARAQSAGPGSALNFDGTNSYVQAPNGIWFSGDFTVEGWVYVRSYNGWSRLIDFANGPNTYNVYLALSAGGTGLPAMGVFTNNNGSPVIESSVQLPLNQWVHLAATLSGTTGAIYMDGGLVGGGTLNRPPSVVRTNNYIGRSNYSVDGYANAIFDDIRIWNIARSQAQIQANMNRSLVGNEPGLISYWRADEGLGTTAADSTTNGQTTTLFGAASWTNSTAPIIAGAGGALDFNSTQYVSVPHQPALNAYPLTAMTWFRAPSGGGALVNKYVSSSLNGYNLFIPGSGHLLAWYFRDGANNVFNGGPMDAGFVADGNWHHAAMVIDASGGKLYLDGVQKSSLPWSGASGPIITTQPVSFNLYPGDSLGSNELDEVSIWNTALSAAQIQTYMNHPLSGTESGLVGYWRLDEGSGTTTADSSGHGNTGTLNGSPIWFVSPVPLVASGPGYALNFTAAASQYVQVLANPSLTPGYFAFEAWVYPRTAKCNTIFSRGDGSNLSATDYIFEVGYDGATCGVMKVAVMAMGTWNASASTIPLNTWTHVAVTYDGANERFYINGALDRTVAIGGTPSLSTSPLYIGRRGASCNCDFFDGQLDEVRLWNGPRSQAQIQQFMHSPLTGTEAGLRAYYRLDEGAGGATVDATGAGNIGALENGPTWTLSTAPISSSGPQVTTLPATGITSTSATLNGAVTANGLPSAVSFQWGATANYGHTIAAGTVGGGFNPVPVTAALSGLSAGAAYHYRVVSSSILGIAEGYDQEFGAPTLALNGANPLTNECHIPLSDPGPHYVDPAATRYIASFGQSSLALKGDSTVVGWGADHNGVATGVPNTNYPYSASGPVVLNGQPLSNVVAITAGSGHSLALKSDGTIVGWGDNTYGELNQPPGLGAVAAISAGTDYNLAVKNDGTVFGWGYNYNGEATGVPNTVSYPFFSSGLVTINGQLLTNVTAVSGFGGFSLALKNDGTVVGWGQDQFGQSTGVVTNGGFFVAGPVVLNGQPLNNVVAIVSANQFALALKSNGTVVAWGDNSYGACNVPGNLSNVVAIAGGFYQSVALKSDGTVATWGGNNQGQLNFPTGLSNVVAIAAGASQTLALRNDGTIAIWGNNTFGELNVPPGLGQFTGVYGTNSNVNVNAPGTYGLSYTATNAQSTAFGPVSRTVVVADTTPPVITLLGANPYTNVVGSPFADPGATANDTCAGVLSNITSNGVVNTSVPGTYTRTYEVTDPSGNSATNSRTVVVVVPVPAISGITLQSGNSCLVQCSGVAGVNYTVQTTTNLASATNWTTFTNIQAGAGGLFQFTTGNVLTNSQALFFRLSYP